MRKEKGAAPTRDRTRVSGGDGQSCDRLLTLTDGVFAIAMTLLIIEVVSAASDVNHEVRLTEQLLDLWPSVVAYLVGFVTLLVCWINNHRVFHYVTRTDSGLVWVNGLQLALVSAVPLPTAVLAANIRTDDRGGAFVLYGFTYVLMALSFWSLSTYVHRRGLADPSADPERYDGMLTIYRFSVLWTLLSVAVAVMNQWTALVLWTFMFGVFAFPAEFAHFMHLRVWRRRGGADDTHRPSAGRV